jgi:hypothetical protein
VSNPSLATFFKIFFRCILEILGLIVRTFQSFCLPKTQRTVTLTFLLSVYTIVSVAWPEIDLQEPVSSWINISMRPSWSKYASKIKWTHRLESYRFRSRPSRREQCSWFGIWRNSCTIEESIWNIQSSEQRLVALQPWFSNSSLEAPWVTLHFVPRVQKHMIGTYAHSPLEHTCKSCLFSIK